METVKIDLRERAKGGEGKREKQKDGDFRVKRKEVREDGKVRSEAPPSLEQFVYWKQPVAGPD